MQIAAHIRRDEALSPPAQSRVQHPIETAPTYVAFGAFRLTARQRQLTEHGKAVALSSRALDILIALLEQPGTVISKSELVARAWPGLHVEESSLRGHVASLRKALHDGEDGVQLIANVQGRGYCFVGSVSGSIEVDHPGRSALARLSDLARDDAVATIAQVLTSEGFNAVLRSAVSDAVRELLSPALHAPPR